MPKVKQIAVFTQEEIDSLFDDVVKMPHVKVAFRTPSTLRLSFHPRIIMLSVSNSGRSMMMYGEKCRQFSAEKGTKQFAEILKLI